VQTGGGIVIDHKLDFSGLLDISRDMELLSKAENKKVLRDGTRAGAEVLKEEVIKRAPERTGKLKRNVVVVTKRAAEMRSRPVSIFVVLTPKRETATTP
jgi:hypothetical protein